MINAAFNHVTTATKLGLGPSRCVEHEAWKYWAQLDEVERFRLGQVLDVQTAMDFVQECKEEALRERNRRVREMPILVGTVSYGEWN